MRERNFRKILVLVGIEDKSTPTWSLEDEMRVYNESNDKNFVPGVSGYVRYIPKDGKFGGL